MTSSVAPANAAAVLFERCRRLLARAGAAAPAKVLAAGPGTHGAGTRLRLTLDELFMRGSRAEHLGHDPLCVVLLQGPESTPPRLRVLGPEALRSHELASPSGRRVGGFVLADLRSDDCEVALALWRVPRSAALRRVGDAVASLDAALDDEHDRAGSIALAFAIVDRLELLAGEDGVRPLLVGRHAWRGTATPAQLLLDGGVTLPPGLQWFMAGTRAAVGRSAEAAVPWSEQEFAVLGLRAAEALQTAERDINQLRRQHALLRGATAVNAAALEGESYLEKAERLRLTNRLSARFGQTGVQRQPVMTPIAIEASADWRQLLLGPEEELRPRFARLLADMRSGLRGQYGLEIPSVRVRLNDTDMPPGSYLFMLDETPLVMNSVATDKALCSATESELSLHGIAGEPTTNPANGNECSWIALDQMEVATRARFAVWRAEEVIVLHLSAVVRRNLAEFAGLQAVSTLVKSKAPDRLERLLAAPRGLARFCGVIRALVSEEAQTRDLIAIVDCFLANADHPTHEVVEHIRCLDSVRSQLNGNDRDRLAPVWLLSNELAALLAAAVLREGDAAVLAIEPELTQEVLAAVRVAVGEAQDAPNGVILVDDWRLRPFVRRLVELEFPHLWVLSRREAFEPDARRVVATIALD